SEELLRGRGLFSRSGRPRPDASEKLERPWPRTGARLRAPSTAVESVPAPGEVFAQLPPTGSPAAEPAIRHRPFEGALAARPALTHQDLARGPAPFAQDGDPVVDEADHRGGRPRE